MDNNNKEKFHENYIEGRNAVLEAFRSGKTIDKLFVLDGCQDGPIKSNKSCFRLSVRFVSVPELIKD